VAPADGSSMHSTSAPLATDSWRERFHAGLAANRFLITFAVLASLMGTSVGMAQVSASLYAVELGSSATMLGLIAGSQSLGVLVMSLPVGMLVERFGPTRPFLLGTLLAGLTYATVPLWATPGWLLACTAAISFFMPLRFVSLNTVFLQQLQALGENKAGWYRGTHMVGMFLLGPALGARAVQSFGFAWTYRLIAGVFLLTLFVSPIVFARYARPPEATHAQGFSAVRSQLGLLFRDAELRTVSLIETVTQAAGAFFTFFVVVLAVSQAGATPTHASSFVAVKGVTFILALFALGGALKRLGPARAYGWSFLLIAASFGLLGVATDARLLWTGSLLLGLGLGSVQIATLTRYAQVGARRGYGRVSGLSALVGPSGGIFGNLLGGVLSKHVGLQSTFLLAALGFLLGFFTLRAGARHVQ
jgi:predicted MFS family arabinose efflux permease